MSHTMTYNNEIERLKIVRYICKIRVYFISVINRHPVVYNNWLNQYTEYIQGVSKKMPPRADVKRAQG